MTDRVVKRLEEAGYFGDRVEGLKQRFKNAANSVGAAVGNAEAGGRYEVGVVVKQLMTLWSRYKGINNIKEATTPNLVAFIKSIGFAMPEKEVAKIYAGAYGGRSSEEEAAAQADPKRDRLSPEMRKQITLLGVRLIKTLYSQANNDANAVKKAFVKLIANPDFTDGSKLFSALQKMDKEDRVVFYKMTYEAFTKGVTAEQDWGVLFAKYYQGINFADQVWPDKIINTVLWVAVARLIIQNGGGARVMGDDKDAPQNKDGDAKDGGGRRSTREPMGDTQLVNFDRRELDVFLQKELPRGMAKTLKDIETNPDINEFSQFENAIAQQFGKEPQALITALAGFMTTVKSGY